MCKWQMALLFLFALSGPVNATELTTRLDKLVKGSGLKESELGLVVTLRHNGQNEELWSHRAASFMVPASLTKVLTAGAILDGLGPSRKLETRLLSGGTVEGDVLRGNLILQGGGDPGFVSETMWFLVNEFSRTGVRKITGDVIVDDLRFDRVRTDTSRQDERVDRAYDAPVGAMSFNWNSVNVFVRPGNKAGDRAKVALDPENSYVTLKGEVKTAASGTKTAVNVERGHTDGRDWIRVSGRIGVDANEFVAYKNITAPELWSGDALVHFLKQRGISVDGAVKVGPTPAGVRQLARAESKPVSAMVADMLKFSNNFVAEMLVKNLSAESKTVPATLADGIEKVRAFIYGLGINKDRLQLLSPSGLNRENRISPADFNQAMLKLRAKFKIFPELMSGLSLAGVDGTLKSRMRGSAAEGRVRAKTGLLTGVAGLAGFAGRDDGTELSFVFMFNGRPSFEDEARSLFDRMAAELVQ